MGGFLDGIDGDRLYRLLQTGQTIIDRWTRWTEWAHEAGQAAEETRHMLVEMLKMQQNEDF